MAFDPILCVDRPVRLHVFQRVRVFSWLFMISCTLSAAAQTDKSTGTPVYPANRYLLVIETSQAMQKRADGLAQTIQDLLSSALASQARRGDTLGLWTFNEELFAGQFPLQHWSPEGQKAIT